MFLDPSAGNRNTEVLQLIVNKKIEKKNNIALLFTMLAPSQSSSCCDP